MPNVDHLRILDEGVQVWNEWRTTQKQAHLFREDVPRPGLGGADLRGRDLRGLNFYRTDLFRADLRNAVFDDTSDLTEADLQGADLMFTGL